MMTERAHLLDFFAINTTKIHGTFIHSAKQSMADSIRFTTKKFQDAARRGDSDELRTLTGQSTSKYVLRDDLHDARVHALLGKHKELADTLRWGKYQINRSLDPARYAEDGDKVDPSNVSRFDGELSDDELLLDYAMQCESYHQLMDCISAGLDVEKAFSQCTRRMDDHVGLIEWLAQHVSRESIQRCYQLAIARKNDVVRGIMGRFGAKALRPLETRRATEVQRERDSQRDFWRSFGFDEPSACA